MGNQVLVAKISYLLDKNEILSRGLDCKHRGYNNLFGTDSPLDGWVFQGLKIRLPGICTPLILKAFIGNLSIKIHLFWRQQPDSLVSCSAFTSRTKKLGARRNLGTCFLVWWLFSASVGDKLQVYKWLTRISQAWPCYY